MRAIGYQMYGGPERLELIDIPRPTLGCGQALIRVTALGVNPDDWKRARGGTAPTERVRFPVIPGQDVVGEVIELGPEIGAPRLGTRVHARTPGAGAAAEFAVVEVDALTPVPDDMDDATAAGLPVAGMLALQALRDHGELDAVESANVLVIGASGGVGHLAVQIAHRMGARVTGVCSARNKAFVSGLGAARVFAYDEPFTHHDHHGAFDVIVDCVGEGISDWLPLLVEDGRYVACAPSPDAVLHTVANPFVGKKVRLPVAQNLRRDLVTLDGLGLRVAIDSRFPLDHLGMAWERSMTRRAVGKIIVDVRPR